MKRRAAAFACLALAAVLPAAACAGGTGEAPAPPPAPAATAAAPPPAAAVPAPPPPLDDFIAGVLYRIARWARGQGDLDRAIAGFRRVRDSDAILSPTAGLRLAQALAAAGRGEESAAAFAAALADPGLHPSLRHVARIEYGDALAALGRAPEAITQYEAAAGSLGAGGYELAEARWASARARRAAGDPLWAADARAAVAAQAYAPSALAALDALDEAGLDAPPLEAALVRYRHFANDAARSRYEAIAADPASPAEGAAAWFYLGALAERVPDNAAAVGAYERSLELAPGGRLADDALWWLALIHQAEGRPERALAALDALRERFPGSPFAPGAGIVAALALARTGDGEAAGERLRAAAASGAPADAAAAARWLGALGLREDGDPLPADFDPSSRAAVFEAAGGAPIVAGDPSEWRLPEADWDEALDWMRARFGPPPEAGADAPEPPEYALAEVLRSAGEQGIARAMLSGLLAGYEGRPWDQLALARRASDAGLHGVALTAAIRLLGPLPPAERAAAPLAIELLAYPAPYADELLAAAEAEGLPPLLLLALVRQESAFVPDAGSPAGALGLTQVIPSTGAQIAESLGVEWRTRLLTDPRWSLRFGAHYLAAQLEAFGGDLLAALAAYNAGPSNAARWRGAQWAPGPDGYAEAVDFTETRLYLERVIENYAWYRWLYLGASPPAIGAAPSGAAGEAGG